jgi:hypothetical protein
MIIDQFLRTNKITVTIDPNQTIGFAVVFKVNLAVGQTAIGGENTGRKRRIEPMRIKQDNPVFSVTQPRTTHPTTILVIKPNGRTTVLFHRGTCASVTTPITGTIVTKVTSFPIERIGNIECIGFGFRGVQTDHAPDLSE